MSAAKLKEASTGLRRSWSPPGSRPWSGSDIAIMKLLKAAEEHACPDSRDALEGLRTRAVRLETGIREALDGMDINGAPAEILRRALGSLG